MEGSMSALLAKPFLRLFLHLWRYLCHAPTKSLLVKRMMQADFCDNNLCFVYNQLQAAKVILNLLNLQEKEGMNGLFAISLNAGLAKFRELLS